IAKTVNSTPCYKYGRTITYITKDCFVSNLPDLSQFLNISNSSEQLDDVTETMDSLFSSILDTVATLRLKNIKENTDAVNFQSVAWIGFYRVAWHWSYQNTPISYEKWYSTQPDIPDTNEACGAVKTSGPWADRDCTVQDEFFCQTGKKLYSTHRYL
uniref:C-type lectin domain-containing protein n=1 Tax=Cyprinus carpio TaxID=7962 RepID=A0A8C1X3W4_CYPCA